MAKTGSKTSSKTWRTLLSSSKVNRANMQTISFLTDSSPILK